MKNLMIHHRDINKIQSYIFMQRLYAHLVVLRYIQFLAKFHGEDKEPDNTTESFTYDTKGNILTAANQNITYTFTYDASGRMLTVTDSNGRVVNYEYNNLGKIGTATVLNLTLNI